MLDEKRAVSVSKYLSFVLRHGAEKEKLKMSEDGTVSISDILRRPKMAGITFQDIQHIISNCPKQRFSIVEGEGGVLRIRANQGHSIKLSEEESGLVRITSPETYPLVVHGTSKKALADILQEGLSRMKRAHIHFATGQEQADRVSHIPSRCDAYIYVDLHKCIADGIPFYISANNVILSPGIGSTGIIPPNYFAKVTHRSGKTIFSQS
eukprot:gene4519-8559_t